jgi:hypothetical protein
VLIGGWVRLHKRFGAAGMRSACGLGTSPAPNLRESARAAPRTRKYRIHFIRCRKSNTAALLACEALVAWAQARPRTSGSRESACAAPRARKYRMHSIRCRESNTAALLACEALVAWAHTKKIEIEPGSDARRARARARQCCPVPAWGCPAPPCCPGPWRPFWHPGGGRGRPGASPGGGALDWSAGARVPWASAPARPCALPAEPRGPKPRRARRGSGAAAGLAAGEHTARPGGRALTRESYEYKPPVKRPRSICAKRGR